MKALLSFDQKNCLKKDGDDYLMIFDNADGEKVLKFKNGVEFDEEITPIVNVSTSSKFSMCMYFPAKLRDLYFCLI